jgi:hypothetical protein
MEFDGLLAKNLNFAQFLRKNWGINSLLSIKNEQRCNPNDCSEMCYILKFSGRQKNS